MKSVQYETVKDVYAIIYGSNIDPMASISDVVADLAIVHQDLNGKLVSDIFTEEEEGFILATMGFHLISNAKEELAEEKYKKMLIDRTAANQESKQPEEEDGMDVGLGHDAGHPSFAFSFNLDVEAVTTPIDNEQGRMKSKDSTKTTQTTSGVCDMISEFTLFSPLPKDEKA